MISDIRKGILKIQNCETDIECLDGDDPCAECRTNQIISYLKREKIARKVDRELPDIEDYCQRIQGYSDYTGRMDGYRKAQEDMLKANFRAFEELE